MDNLQLSSEHITYLLTVLRNSSQPLTTADLVKALRDRASSSK